jgi:tagaturonate epimerase
MPLSLPRFSFGVGDRFSRQAAAQLRAFRQTASQGVEIAPVWNKSYREHCIVHSHPSSTRAAADAAVQEAGWTSPYFVDADHINLSTVEGFFDACDFFTIDIAAAIGKPASGPDVDTFVARHSDLSGYFGLTPRLIRDSAAKYLYSVQEAERIYRRIEAAKGAGNFITEVSLDETDVAQGPGDLLVILAAIADTEIPVQTIAPKFTGRFNKGVEYVGDVDGFEREFRDDVAALLLATGRYPLSSNLKLSVHSGSDKFALYPRIRRVLAETGAGVHVKTAGTTWLEELIGLAEAGGEGLALAKDVYAQAYARREALCAPYAEVIDIDPACLPSPHSVQSWNSEEFVAALRHDQSCPAYNLHLRQLLHVGYKVAAEMGPRYLALLDSCRESVSRNVTTNLYDRHIIPLFLGTAP